MPIKIPRRQPDNELRQSGNYKRHRDKTVHPEDIGGNSQNRAKIWNTNIH